MSYDALLAAGAPADQAREAAVEIVELRGEVADLKSRVRAVTAIAVVNLALTAAIVVELFLAH